MSGPWEMGHRPGALADLRQKQVSLPDMAPENLTAGWQEAKIYVTSPELFFFPAESHFATEMSQGS